MTRIAFAAEDVEASANDRSGNSRPWCWQGIQPGPLFGLGIIHFQSHQTGNGRGPSPDHIELSADGDSNMVISWCRHGRKNRPRVGLRVINDEVAASRGRGTACDVDFPVNNGRRCCTPRHRQGSLSRPPIRLGIVFEQRIRDAKGRCPPDDVELPSDRRGGRMMQRKRQWCHKFPPILFRIVHLDGIGRRSVGAESARNVNFPGDSGDADFLSRLVHGRSSFPHALIRLMGHHRMRA